jgi:FixJ family two-component response regulator
MPTVRSFALSSRLHAFLRQDAPGFALFIRALTRRKQCRRNVDGSSGQRREPASLGSREHQILARAAVGKTSKEIAAELGITTRTVETHRARLMRKIVASSIADLVRYAIKNRIIAT